jgi:hypothetical protein
VTTEQATPHKPRQLTEADVHRLFVARKYEAINRAREAGQLDDLLAGRQQPTDDGPTAA